MRLADLGLVVLTVLAGARPAPAHALGVECKLHGDRVEVEAYYDDDTPAVGARVRVLDLQKNVTAQGETDALGKWSFARPQPGRYRVIVDAGSGHRTELDMNVPDAAATGVAPAAVPISEGPSRSEFTRFPLLHVGIGLAAIAVFGLAAWIGLRRRPTPGPPTSG